MGLREARQRIELAPWTSPPNPLSREERGDLRVRSPLNDLVQRIQAVGILLALVAIPLISM